MIAAGLTGSPLDRADAVRTDPAALARAIADPAARLLILDGVDPMLDKHGLLTWGGTHDADPDALILLGLIDGVPHFAELGPSRARGVPIAALGTMPRSEAATYAAARSLILWHARHRFCANCGTPTLPFRAGWGRRCEGCATDHFPRVDPVVIMLAEHDGQVLVGRQPRFAPGSYSALAGFVEPGESIEEAVARELHEEAGITVDAVRYVASQPWPFVSSLMIACIAEATSTEILLDTNELEDAKWVDRAAVLAALAREPDAPFRAPNRYAIAHTLLRHWAER